MGMSSRRRAIWLAGWGWAWWLFAQLSARGETVDFGRDVLPVLANRCYRCHGPDPGPRQAGLRLDVRENAVAERKGRVVIRPGAPDRSELLRRITSLDPEVQMPPPGEGARLDPEQVKRLATWIAEGAEYSEHWAFRPLARGIPPTIARVDWLRTPVDAFVLKKLETADLKPAPEASRRTWIRRASLDVIGLPPSPAEVEAFLQDHTPDAYERVVDRLLANPHYGERWGRHWLDVARYADSGGFETDLFFGHAWRYRDYVIASFNANQPFDAFVREQMAGDEMNSGAGKAAVATGFFTVGPVLQESGMVPGKLEYDQLTDAVDTTCSTFLGLTAGCARCHDHKYDPLSQKEYFGLQAIFAASDQFDVLGGQQKAGGRAALNNVLPEFEQEQKRVRARRQASAPGPEVDSPLPVRVLAHRPEPVPVHLLKRGELEHPGDAVQPGLPMRLGAGQRDLEKNPHRWRTVLADWIASPENPLTARVFVNRIWQWHFGTGLVRTPNDFGVRGERPTHPELLDWLAAQFVATGWDVKRLHRLILLSSTYRMSSVADTDALRGDPENRLLTRYPAHRLEAEVIWDLLLETAGNLNLEMGGLSVAPPLDDQEQIGNFLKWPANTPTESRRRAVYLLIRRSFRFPLLSAFDLPDNITSCGLRDATSVPNQSLTLLNSRLVREQALAFADRLLRECAGEPVERLIDRAWRLAYGRSPAGAEREQVLGLLRVAHPEATPVSAVSGEFRPALEQLCLALLNTNELIFTP